MSSYNSFLLLSWINWETFYLFPNKFELLVACFVLPKMSIQLRYPWVRKINKVFSKMEEQLFFSILRWPIWESWKTFSWLVPNSNWIQFFASIFCCNLYLHFWFALFAWNELYLLSPFDLNLSMISSGFFIKWFLWSNNKSNFFTSSYQSQKKA